MQHVDWYDVQGNILNGYTFPLGVHLFLHAEDQGAIRQLLQRLVDKVTPAAHWGSTPNSAVNLGLTFSGLRTLGLPAELLMEFPIAFQEGTRARASQLGDVGDSAPSRWVPCLGTDDVHLLITLHAKSQ